ncbi:hypothetical protein AVEN_148912-1 [Araneus ventricosus]|uniref:Uncharacterized protein n=1 Tax=Araneus ventricosus TaxID=182803 RepID=A0A4Y2DIL7_ARAVE|nr:hypothetical protein AVEN_148912-1 [Araneus ventricosus]
MTRTTPELVSLLQASGFILQLTPYKADLRGDRVLNTEPVALRQIVEKECYNTRFVFYAFQRESPEKKGLFRILKRGPILIGAESQTVKVTVIIS